MSASTSRYKSKLFNFLNRQSIRLSDTIEKTVRQIKVATEWSLQIVLYPLYLLAQSSRFIGYQLQPQKQQQDLLLISTSSNTDAVVTSEQAIEEVIDTATHLLNYTLNQPFLEVSPPQLHQEQEEFQLSLDVTQPINQNLIQQADTSLEIPEIQGIATLLSNQKLVLVDFHNQILDILTPLQQQQLEKTIASKAADNSPPNRLENSKQQTKNYLPPLKDKSKSPILPIRLFSQLINWMQSSPVAVAINLFGESEIGYKVNYEPELPNFPYLIPPLPLTEVLTTIDAKVAVIETKTITPVSQLIHNLTGSKQVILEANKDLQTNSSSENHPFQIQALIQAAIEYFFRQKDLQIETKSKEVNSLNGKELPALNSQSSFSSSNSDLVNFEQPDPWLTIGDVQNNYNHNLPVNQANYLENSQFNPLKIQTIIRAAIEYFFAKKPRKSVVKGKQTQVNFQGENFLDTQALPPAPEVDPWLEWDDLYTENQANVDINSDTDRMKSGLFPLPQATKTPTKPGKSLRANLHQTLTRKTKTSALTSQQQKPQKGKIRHYQQTNTEISPKQTQSENREIKATPNWLEVEVKPVGYVKHPLEKVLEWLDHSILWLEEIIGKIWQWFKPKP